MAIQDDKTILNKGDLKAYHQKILPYLGGNMMVSTNNSDFYSTDEKVVGVWTDGKPVYQKTLIDTLPDTSADGTAAVKSISIGASVDTIVGYDGLFENVSHYTFPMMLKCGFNASGTLDWLVMIDATTNATTADPNVVRIHNSRVAYNSNQCRVTIQYTKTTDTADSATTTPGAYDINFPNTWKENTEIYFGNGLYGYRQVRTTPSTPRTQYPIIAGVKKIVSYGGTEFRNSDGYGHPIGCATSSPATSSDNAYPYLYIEGATMTSGTGTLSIWGADVGMKGWDVWATYCK